MKNINKISDQDMANVVGGTLTQEEALTKALTHAKLSRDQLDFVKNIEMDFEHGRKVYEIRFYQGGFEYEYDIDAETGNILKFERDFD